MQKIEIKNALDRFGWGRCWEELERRLSQQLLLTFNGSKFDVSAMGNSKFGGEPDLPNAIKWPKYQRRGSAEFRTTGKPMTFLLQLRCNDFKPLINAATFPDHGLLSFFIGIEQNELVRLDDMQIVAQVIYSHSGMTQDGNVEPFVRMPFPQSLYSGYRLPPGTVKIEPSFVPDFDVLVDLIDHEFGYSPELHDEIRDFYRQHFCQTGQHKMFGAPSSLELDIVEECRLIAKQQPSDNGLGPSTETSNDDWLLLLEFDLDVLHDVLSEFGRLYFMIRRNDLEAMRFHEMLVVYDV